MQAFIDAVTRFIFVQDPPEKSQVLFVPGSTHPEHVHLAARLYHEGYAPLILPSGKYAKGKPGFEGAPGYASEWAYMRDLLIADHVPPEAILREDQATYTWENALRSRDVLRSLGLQAEHAILCCKSFHARRALFYYSTAMPELTIHVCPYDIPGFTAQDWYRTPEGRRTILGEVRKMGDQICEIFEDSMKQYSPGGEPLA